MFCDGEQLLYNGELVTFNKTEAGFRTNSLESCLNGKLSFLFGYYPIFYEIPKLNAFQSRTSNFCCAIGKGTLSVVLNRGVIVFTN